MGLLQSAKESSRKSIKLDASNGPAYWVAANICAAENDRMGFCENIEKAMRLGTLLQPAVAEIASDRGYGIMPAPADGFTHPEHAWMICHPDGFASVDGERAVELPERLVRTVPVEKPLTPERPERAVTRIEV